MTTLHPQRYEARMAALAANPNREPRTKNFVARRVGAGVIATTFVLAPFIITDVIGPKQPIGVTTDTLGIGESSNQMVSDMIDKLEAQYGVAAYDSDNVQDIKRQARDLLYVDGIARPNQSLTIQTSETPVFHRPALEIVADPGVQLPTTLPAPIQK